MNLGTFSFSRLLMAGLFTSLLIMIVTGCDKKDKQTQPPTIPVVTTAGLTNISYNAATGGGSIVSDGGAPITASGIVWSKTNATPTLEDSVVAGTTATGTFTSELSGLEENTSYYIRAFATNGIGTGYGNVVTLNTTNDTNKVRFTYKGEEVVYGIIVSLTTGRKWLDRNLGAKQVATAFDDYLAYGDFFQWGRPDDGHQLMNWTSSTDGTPVNGITATLATSDTPGHSNWILADESGATPYTGDWRDDNNSNRWMINSQGPCPAGWHVPTKDEWLAEIAPIDGDGFTTGGTAASGGITDGITAYNLLKLTLAGARRADGTLRRTGSRGRYWSSTDRISPDPFTDANDVETSPTSVSAVSTTKSEGSCVRCIKD